MAAVTSSSLVSCALPVVMIGGKRVLVFGYGDMGKGSAFAMRGVDASVMIVEGDPTCALQACMNGFQAAALESVVHEINIFVTSAGTSKIIGLEHMQKMENNTIVGNIDHLDKASQMAELEGVPGISRKYQASGGSFCFPSWSLDYYSRLWPPP